MNRFKLFISNFLVYGLGGVISKIIPFIMLPIVTRLMPNTTYFGLNDISTIIVSFASALAIMGMYDAMFRMFFEKEDEVYKKEICSSALAFTLCTSIVIFLILLIFRKFFSVLFFSSAKYTNLLMLTAISTLIGATNSIVSAPVRFNNKRKIYLLTNTISPIISYGISIPLLLNGYYIVALPIASIISASTIEIVFICLNRKWFSFKKIHCKYIKQMLVIALPLLPNFLIYWIFNSADKLMIAKLLGNDQVGIYAIGSKIGQISQLIYTAFAGGWQYFSFSTMKDDDQVEMTSNILEYLGSITIVSSMYMMTFNEVVFSLLFKDDYLLGAIVAPYLFTAPLLLMLFQIGCNQFIIIKKTWPNLLILSSGAVLNIVLNLLLIPRIGIEGAALATLIGYIVSVGICVIVLQKMKLLKMSKRFYIIVLLGVTYSIAWRFILQKTFILNILITIIITFLVLLQYRKDIEKLVKSK